MLRELDIRELKKQFDIKPTGMIQVGSFVVKEYQLLKEVGFNKFIFIEANAELIPALKENVGENCIIFNELISDVDNKEYLFNISNHTQASSLLQFNKHSEYYPELSTVIKQVPIKSITLDSLFDREDIDLNQFNFLMMDVQGAELMVLKGFEKHIHMIDYIYTEINFDSMYIDCVLEKELTSYLKSHGFALVKFFDTGHGWGDGLYIRKGKYHEQ